MHPFHAFSHHFHREMPPEDPRHHHGSHHHGGRHRGGRDHGGRDHGGDEAGERGGRGRFGRGGRADLGRFFAHGDLRFVILQLTAEKPRHGYEIIKAIEDRVGGAYSPSPGVVYPTLTMLEELGHVSVTPDGAKKLYAITPEGQAVLDANRSILDTILAKMAEAADAFGDGPPPSVVRASESLKLALKMRLARGPLKGDEAAAVAAALDAATAAIERS